MSCQPPTCVDSVKVSIHRQLHLQASRVPGSRRASQLARPQLLTDRVDPQPGWHGRWNAGGGRSTRSPDKEVTVPAEPTVSDRNYPALFLALNDVLEALDAGRPDEDALRRSFDDSADGFG